MSSHFYFYAPSVVKPQRLTLSQQWTVMLCIPRLKRALGQLSPRILGVILRRLIDTDPGLRWEVHLSSGA